MESTLLREWGTSKRKKNDFEAVVHEDDPDDYDEIDTEDVIEMYNEFGELIGTYTASEYELMRSQKKR